MNILLLAFVLSAPPQAPPVQAPPVERTPSTRSIPVPGVTNLRPFALPRPYPYTPGIGVRTVGPVSTSSQVGTGMAVIPILAPIAGRVGDTSDCAT